MKVSATEPVGSATCQSCRGLDPARYGPAILRYEVIPVSTDAKLT
jgi:hypothetical protein